MISPSALLLVAMVDVTGGCLAIDLSGFPDNGVVVAGQRLEIMSALSNGCNAPRVESADLHCAYDDGRREDMPMEVEVSEGKAVATATLLVDGNGVQTLSCYISFSQCGWSRSETCRESAGVSSPVREPPHVFPRRTPERERPPQPVPSPPVSSGSGSMGDGMQVLGGLAVLAGLGLHASASTEEEEGNTAKAEDYKKQGNEAIAGGVVLWLLGSLLDEEGTSGALQQRMVRTMRENIVLDLGRERIGIVYRWRL